MICFQYWDKGIESMSPMICYIYEHNLQMSEIYGFELVLISDKNVSEYIDVPTKYWKLAHNFKSDIVRFFILHKYGGIWLDTDIIILKNLNETFHVFEQSDYFVMLDTEYGKNIGCASIFMKPNNICSDFCVKYIIRVLNSKRSMHWGCLGPDNAMALVKQFPKWVQINACDVAVSYTHLTLPTNREV